MTIAATKPDLHIAGSVIQLIPLSSAAGQSVDLKTNSVGGFYSDEAAAIASEAARAQQAAPRPAAPMASPTIPAPQTRTIPHVMLDQPRRPPLAPDPAINQNFVAARPAPPAFGPDRRFGAARIVAWIVLAPWYLAVIVAAIGLDAMFIKDLLRL